MFFTGNDTQRFSALIIVSLLVLSLFALPGKGDILVTGDRLREYTLKPGETFQGEIMISNPGEDPTGFKVTQSDYLFFADGRNKYPPAGSTVRSNADWITISIPPEVTINPEEQFPLNFEIQVPDDPSLIGTYWSTILIQGTRPTTEGPVEGIRVRQIIRYGVQIAVNIGDTGERKIDLLEVKPVDNNGSKLVQVNVKNVGQRAVSPIAKVELYDQGGKKYGPFEGSEYMIYPGCSVSYKVPLKEVPDKKFQGVILIDNGDQYIWGAREEIDFSSNNSSDTEE